MAAVSLNFPVPEPPGRGWDLGFARSVQRPAGPGRAEDMTGEKSAADRAAASPQSAASSITASASVMVRPAGEQAFHVLAGVCAALVVLMLARSLFGGSVGRLAGGDGDRALAAIGEDAQREAFLAKYGGQRR